MNVRSLISALQGQNPDSDVFYSVGGTLYDLDHVGTPTANATVLFVNDTAADTDSSNEATSEINSATPQPDENPEQANAETPNAETER